VTERVKDPKEAIQNLIETGPGALTSWPDKALRGSLEMAVGDVGLVCLLTN